MVYVFYKNHSTNISLLEYILCKNHVYNPALIVQMHHLRFKTVIKNSLSIFWKDYPYMLELLDYVFCEAHNYNPELKVLGKVRL